MKEMMNDAEEMPAKISGGANESLSEEDKETLRALAAMFKHSGTSLGDTERLFKERFPGSWEPFTGYINEVWVNL